MYYLIRYSTMGGKKRVGICSALGENYAQFQSYNMEKSDFCHHYLVQSAL